MNPSSTSTDQLVQAVAAGFEALQVEYQKLHGQHQTLERRLNTAREQYNELAKLCNSSGALSTPPLSLSSAANPAELNALDSYSAAEILDQNPDRHSQAAAHKIREATQALHAFKHRAETDTKSENGVKIWSGRSADPLRANSSSRLMPVVTESALEQDFTIEGVPSKLGCPFASMAGKKLSSHAASVLSRYNHGSAAAAPSTPTSAASRINGRESFAKRSASEQPAPPDPIKAEVCGISDHDQESPYSERVVKDQGEKQDDAEVGVCPIRFLDQHSPEEVATYFENHKHELPRSHEVCVKRYQSNEQQIRELDAKYGNLVAMIQGLGAKHKGFLSKEPDEDIDPVDAEGDAKSAEKVRQWANSVSAQAMDGREENEAHEDDEERLPHFERPLRDIRVGESPSRPWGISVPVQYLERRITQTSSQPAAVQHAPESAPDAGQKPAAKSESRAKCPFDFTRRENPPHVNDKPGDEQQKAARIDKEAHPTLVEQPINNIMGESPGSSGRMVFTGPVFIGYSAEDAAKILHTSGLKMH